MNIRVGRIAQRQATMGGFAPEPTPSPPHPVASDFVAEEMMMMIVMMMTLQMMMEMLALPMRCLLDTLPFVTRDKKGRVVLDMRVVTLRERVSFWDHCVRGSVVIFFRDVVRMLCIFSFLFFLRYIVLVHEVL